MQEEINFEIRQFFWFPHSLASGCSVKIQYQYNKGLCGSLQKQQFTSSYISECFAFGDLQ